MEYREEPCGKIEEDQESQKSSHKRDFPFSGLATQFPELILPYGQRTRNREDRLGRDNKDRQEMDDPEPRIPDECPLENLSQDDHNLSQDDKHDIKKMETDDQIGQQRVMVRKVIEHEGHLLGVILSRWFPM